jgi:hypothetical protein
VLFCAASTFGQSPSIGQGAKVYIVPSDGFEIRLSAAISKHHVPVVVVDGQDQAEFKVTTSVSPSGKETFYAVKVSDAGTSQVVWSYTGKSKNFSADKAADEIAKRLRNYIEPPVSASSRRGSAERAGSQPLCCPAQIAIGAGRYWFVRFEVDPERMPNAKVQGTFYAAGGSGNDIQAVVGEEAEFLNWINGHGGSVLYASEKTTAGKLDVPIQAQGAYILAFSNKFSILSAKAVTGDVSLNYGNDTQSPKCPAGQQWNGLRCACPQGTLAVRDPRTNELSCVATPAPQ